MNPRTSPQAAPINASEAVDPRAPVMCDAACRAEIAKLVSDEVRPSKLDHALNVANHAANIGGTALKLLGLAA